MKERIEEVKKNIKDRIEYFDDCGEAHYELCDIKNGIRAAFGLGLLTLSDRSNLYNFADEVYKNKFE